MVPFAFVFPGQGSQSVGMLSTWGDHPEVRRTLDEAGRVLDTDIAALIARGPKEALDLTSNTQPVMLTAGVACYRAWVAETGARPMAVAGHSLGEYTALVAAGVLSLADALPLVRFRAEAMQEAVPVGAGAMAAILGLEASEVQRLCAQVEAETGEVVAAANFNDPKQTVIAGHRRAVDQACELMKANGAKRALPLAVSAPFHCRLMKPAAERLAPRLAATSLASPSIPVVNNVDVAAPDAPEAIRDALVRQAAAPVRWVETMQAMHAAGVTHVFECGPGKVLSGLVKRCVDAMSGAAMNDLAAVEAALAAVSHAGDTVPGTAGNIKGA